MVDARITALPSSMNSPQECINKESNPICAGANSAATSSVYTQEAIVIRR